jgi:hypothetical protein
MRGGTGVVPFRAGDWKCGENGCGYHNFAKNTACLRCGASRAGAAVVADSAFPSPMDTPSGFGMGPSSMGGTPGAGPYGPAGFAGGYPPQQYGAPPSSYALPSGMGGASPYAPMGAGYMPNGGMQHTPFDNRSAEAAFSAADPYPSQGASNGGNGDGRNDPFAFLSSGFGSLSMNDDRRGASNSANKSPA